MMTFIKILLSIWPFLWRVMIGKNVKYKDAVKHKKGQLMVILLFMISLSLNLRLITVLYTETLEDHQLQIKDQNNNLVINTETKTLVASEPIITKASEPKIESSSSVNITKKADVVKASEPIVEKPKAIEKPKVDSVATTMVKRLTNNEDRYKDTRKKVIEKKQQEDIKKIKERYKPKVNKPKVNKVEEPKVVEQKKSEPLIQEEKPKVEITTTDSVSEDTISDLER